MPLTAFDSAFLSNALAAQMQLPVRWFEPQGKRQILEEVFTAIEECLVGQHDALGQIHRTLAARVEERDIAWHAGLSSMQFDCDRRPLACILAHGPSGVGKTETARLLAERLFSGRTIILNGADVGPEAAHGVATWVGSPPGYVGFNQGGVLTDGLMRSGPCVIIVDEMEKAAREALQNVLLPLMGEGTVTDRSTGQTLWASECVVFATSNLTSDGRKTAHNAATHALKPELRGRFNAIVPYRSLTAEDLCLVWRHELERTAQRLGIDDCRITEAAWHWVRVRVSRADGGARAAQDLFRETLLPLLRAGESDVTVDVRGDELIVS